MAKEFDLFLMLLLSMGIGTHCTNRIYNKNYDKTSTEVTYNKNSLNKKVAIYDIKASSKGILETETMAGCYAGLVFSIKNDEPFALLSHYPSTQIASHLNAIKKEKDFWLQLQNYDKAILIAFMKNNSDNEYIKNFLDFYQEFHKLFSDAKILAYKYNLGETIKVNLDCGTCSVGKRQFSIIDLLRK